MKKILLITVDAKPKELSTAKTVSQKLIQLLDEFEITNLDLSKEYLPELNYRYFSKRATLTENYQSLNEAEKKDIKRLNYLADEFILHDIYIIVTPMWGISFPYKLKHYLDCIVLDNKLIKVTDGKIKGLLKHKSLVYIQSSGGKYSKFYKRYNNHGLTYINDLFKLLGVKKIDTILIEGTEMREIGADRAILQATPKVTKIFNKLVKLK